MLRYFSVALILFIMGGCANTEDKTTYFPDAFAYARTVKELNEVVKFNNFTPIVACRNYTYANIAAYECIAAGYPGKYVSLGNQLNGLGTLPKKDSAQKIDAEFASLLAFCIVGESVTFPIGSMKTYIDSLKKIARNAGMSDAMFKTSEAFAQEISKAIIAWSKNDNYLQTRSAAKYRVIDTPGRWVPTPPAYTGAIEPHWAEIRTLVMDSANQFVPPPPVAYNMTDKNGPYYRQVMAIKNATDSLTPEQKHMADFWDDLPGNLHVSGHVMYITKKFSPPGHWMNIVGIASKTANADFATTVEAYALTSISMFDAFIQCWDEKYRSNMPRPETVINKFIDPDWRPHLQTPPFPEYTCGHNTVCSAAAEALTTVFGENFHYKDTSELEFGIASRSYNSFRHAAEENTWARFYGGIHFHPSCVVSNEYGKKVGELITGKLVLRKKD